MIDFWGQVLRFFPGGRDSYGNRSMIMITGLLSTDLGRQALLLLV
jgi:hypothetical protein